MPTTSTVAVWRRVLLITITALIAALAVTFSAPPPAEAIVNPNVVLSGTKGWVYVRNEARACPMIYPTPAYCYEPAQVAAWRWSGSAWSQSSLAGGTQVYAWPYAAGWHWVWTQRTGWLAISTQKLEHRYSCTGPTCPVF